MCFYVVSPLNSCDCFIFQGTWMLHMHFIVTHTAPWGIFMEESRTTRNKKKKYMKRQNANRTWKIKWEKKKTNKRNNEEVHFDFQFILGGFQPLSWKCVIVILCAHSYVQFNLLSINFFVFNFFCCCCIFIYVNGNKSAFVTKDIYLHRRL